MNTPRLCALVTMGAALVYACVGEDPVQPTVVVINDGGNSSGEDGSTNADSSTEGDAAQDGATCTQCDGGCVDLKTSPTNCGACGKICDVKECTAGECSGKLIFVTSGMWQGNFGGLANGDLLCQQSAQKAGLGGTYKAWLSADSGAPVGTANAADRVTHSTKPYKNPRGEVIALDFVDLIDGQLEAGVHWSEDGGDAGPPFSVWTGSTYNGKLYSDQRNCKGWTTNANTPGDQNTYGRTGYIYVTSNSWAEGSSDGCYLERHLYCIEQ